MDGNDKYVGKILDKRYEILERIGTGGMAFVYKARCHRLNRMVAIKILKDELADDEEFRRRFSTESQAVAMLSHPNIVAVYDVSHSGSIEYIVMELIDGITLKQYMNRKGLLTWKEALHFSTQIAKALSHAHSRGIIHRDIKPHNIMILKDGSVKVADFGIARLITMKNTLTQDTLGSVHYISPEQAKGGYVDARSDIYSVGVVLYEMLTSRLPFVGASPVAVAIQHISAIPLMPRDINPDIPVGLEDITMHAMEPDLNMRFTTADELLNDLETFRKNPAIIFDYAMSDPRDRQTDNIANLQTTKPSTPSVAPKPDRAAQPKPRSPRKLEMSSDEYRNAKRRSSSNSTLIGIFSVLVVIIILLVFMWQTVLKPIFNPVEVPQITIPKFVGSKYEELIRDGEYDELYNFIVSYDYSNDYAAGVIISQKPVSGRSQDTPASGKKIDVTIIVSSGEPEEKPVEMPYLIEKYYSEAINQLDNLHLDLNIEQEPLISDTIPKGIVYETLPSAGMMLMRGNTVVIRYSLGPDVKWVTVPDYVGKPRAQLEDAFEANNLIAEFSYYPDNSEEGTVLFIARKGEKVKEGTKLVVHISSGPPEPSTPETPVIPETPTPVIPETPSPTPSEPPITDTSPPPSPSESPSPESPSEPPPTTDLQPPMESGEGDAGN